MDSRLLNLYHDDPYDVNYDNFESGTADLWSTDNIGIDSMELADTFDGILPLAATETDNDICNIMFDDSHIYDDKEFISIRNPNLLVYNDFTQQQLKAGERVGSIDTDLMSYDVSHSISNTNDFVSNKDIKVEDDARSHCSEISFRTRTDSSSIGDYESHTSDYDDEDDDIVDNDGDSVFDEQELEKDDILTDLPELNLLNNEDFTFTANGTKQRTISTNTIDSDVDAINFDLAEFITNDDVPAKPKDAIVPQPFIKPIVEVISSKLDENDSDSDVIVDVETVEFEEAKERALLLKNASIQLPEDNLIYVDNVKEDPSWSPKELKTKQNSNKKQSDISKSGTQRGKNGASTKSNNNNKISAKNQILKSTPLKVENPSPNLGIGRGGKNLALLKRDCESIEDDGCQVRVKEKDIAQLKHDSHRIDPRTQSRETFTKKNETEKRKLNLEEYKRRHGEDFSNISKAKIVENKSIVTAVVKSEPNSKAQTPTKSKQHSEAVTSIVKTLKEEQTNNIDHKKTDPITQAKNKVLRMQELKKAQQMKIIDSTISAKVPRVTKLLPLQEIIKDTAYAIKDEKPPEVKPQFHANSDYIKIVMVSAACNTALSLSPSDVLRNVPLLDNITRVKEHVKISNNSLITSIQDAVIKQSLPKITYPTVESSIASTSKSKKHSDADFVQHGEDKIIMHLRKDRIRGPTRSIAIQTDFQAAFPTLPMMDMFRKSHNSKNKTSRRKYRKRNISTASSSQCDDTVSDHGRCENDSESEYILTKQNRKNGCISSTEYQNSEAAASVGGYSSRSSRRHRSSVSSSYSESGHQRSSRSRKRKSSYRKSVRKQTRSSSCSSSLSEYSDRSRSRSRNRTRSRSPYYRDSRSRHESSNICDRNVSKPAVEERRIVYVGRIEEETTREILRRKFIVYGSIKQITIHYKETGMKYGFVTFERAIDAFAVIDNSTKDSQINMYDISFGGRRAFCRTSYADLDNAGINNYHSYVFPKTVTPKSEDSFEALLQKVKAKLDANKSSSNNKT